MEDPFPNSSVKLENNDFVDSVGLFVDGSLFMDPEMKLKAEPGIFESSEGDMKHSFDSDASVSEEDLQISKREFSEEEEFVKTGVKEECGMQLGCIRKENRGNKRGRVKEYLQNEEQIKNIGCEDPLCQESDSKTHTDVGTKEKSFVGGNYEKQFSGVVNPNSQKLIHTGGQFRCRKCGKTFSKQVDLEAHDEIHIRSRSFKCNDCGKEFFRKRDLIPHMRTHSVKKSFKCSVCDKVCSCRSELTKHYRIHTGEKPFKCSVCDKAFPQSSHLSSHNKIHTRGEKSYKCSNCGMAFTWKSSLSRHLKICTGCIRKENRGNKRGRVKEYLQNEEQIKNIGFEDPLCQESDSKSHTDVGPKEKSFVGGNYEKQFSGVVNPNSQKLIHTGGQFRCRKCGKTFSKQVDLEAHDETHIRSRSFKCNDCGKEFFQKRDLIPHMRTHSVKKSFKCSVCDKVCSYRSELTKHYRIHTGEKPFKCSVCDKTFPQSSHLSSHNEIHTRGEKSYKCSNCGMAFTWKSSRSRHLKICTGENL